MKIWCDADKEARKARKKTFHKWFAWHPVYVPDAKCYVWLAFVERSGEYRCSYGGCGDDWEYRSIA